MLDVYRNNTKKTTTAVIENSELDALRHISKKIGLDLESDDYLIENDSDVLCLDTLLMSDKYTGTVTCAESDEYSDKVGEDMAVKKAMNNHRNGFKRAIVRWQTAMIKKILGASPETFSEALQKANVCKCNK